MESVRGGQTSIYLQVGTTGFPVGMNLAGKKKKRAKVESSFCPGKWKNVLAIITSLV